MNRMILFLLFFVFICSAEASPVKFHRFYFGEDFYTYQDFHDKYIKTKKGKKESLFKGYKIGYDYISSSGPYLGLDFQKSRTNGNEQSTCQKNPFSNKLSKYEGRLGFTLPLQQLLVTPFCGLGSQKWHWENQKSKTDGYEKLSYKWNYLCFGARFLCVFSYVDVGVNFELQQMVSGKARLYENDLPYETRSLCEKKPFSFHLQNTLQFELEVPIYFHPESFRPFDIAIVPFYRKYNVGNELTFLEGMIVGPKNEESEFGTRIEIALRL